MKKVSLLFICASILLSTKVFCQGFSPQYSISTSILGEDLEWGDWNNDGYLDFMVIGEGHPDRPSKIYRYTGSGFSSYIDLPVLGTDGNFDMCDYDRDGDLDFAMNDTHDEFRIFKKNGSSYSLAYDFNLEYDHGMIKWINFNNDMYMDIILSGRNISGGTLHTKIFQGTGSGFTEVTGLNLPTLDYAEIECVDFNEDGYEDFIYSGRYAVNDYRTFVYYNYQGTQFYALTPSVFNTPQVTDIECGDFDGDGYTDVLLTSYNTTKIYKNQGSYFSYFTSISVGNLNQKADWGDADLDGDLDILIGGRTDGNIYIYKYNNNSYSLYQTITYGKYGDVEWGDYDNDGDLDIAISAYFYDSYWYYGVKIYKNNISNYFTNNAPGTPTNLYDSRNGNDVTLHWTAPSDDHTPSASLSYNVYLYNTYVTLIRPMSNVSVNQRNYVADNGNTNFNEYLIENLGTGLTYYWKVQAIDGSFKAGNWASSSFYLSSYKSGNTAEEPLYADEQVNNGFLSVYPNPSYGNIYIDGIKGQYNIMVTDMSGKNIINSSNLEGKVQVDLSTQPKGIYFLSVESAGEIKTERIVLQ